MKATVNPQDGDTLTQTKGGSFRSRRHLGDEWAISSSVC
jgi:hypothetical protein